MIWQKDLIRQKCHDLANIQDLDNQAQRLKKKNEVQFAYRASTPYGGEEKEMT
jgi:hypothetical protein